jgi:hypothetical protein
MRLTLFSALVLLAGTLFSQEQSGFLDIKTTPAGATLRIDGVDRGKTPVFLALPVGRHTIEISYTDYESQSIVIDISKNEITKQEIVLAPATGFRVKEGERRKVDQAKGKLTIITEPPGAAVYVDGEDVQSVTPLTLEELGAGIHIVRLTAFPSPLVDQDFEVVKNVSIRPHETELLRIRLTDYARFGRVKLRSNRDGGEAALRDMSSGKIIKAKFPSEMEVLVADYELEYTATDQGISFVSDVVNGFKVPRVDRSSESQKSHLTVTSGRTTVIFLPSQEPLLKMLAVTNHPDYQTLDEYLSRHFQPLPESEVQARPNGWALGVSGGLTALGVAMLSSNEVNSNGKGWGVVFVLGGPAVFVYSLVNPSEKVDVSLPENKTTNESHRRALTSEYNALLHRWQSDIDAANSGIEARNREIRGRNAGLGGIKVTYE